MTTLANSAARERGQAPVADAEVGAPIVVLRGRFPVHREQAATPGAGDTLGVETRPATQERTGYLVPNWGQDFGVDHFTGLHGAFAHRPAFDPKQAGGQQPWDVSRRTLRSAPTGAWDAGTAIGRSA